MHDNLTDAEMVQKKEDDRNKVCRRKDIRDAVSNSINRSDLTNNQKLNNIERDSDECNNLIDELSSDSLHLARRLVNVSHDINLIKTDVLTVKTEVTAIQTRAKLIKDNADLYEIREDKKFEIRRITILTAITISVPAIIAILSLLLLYKII